MTYKLCLVGVIYEGMKNGEEKIWVICVFNWKEKCGFW